MYILGHHVLVYVLLVGAVLVTVATFWKGDAAVRYAGLTHLAVEVAQFIIHPRFGDTGAESIVLAVDFISSVVLLLLAVRFAALWLGATMMLQSALFSLHAYYLVMELPQDRVHAWINNTCDWGIITCIVTGLVTGARRRKALAREDAERAARRQQLLARV